MAENGTALERWYKATKALCQQAVTLIDSTAGPQRQYALGVGAQIAGATEGRDVGAGISRAQAQEMAALWTAFSTWMPGALADEWAHGKSPLQILTELGEV